MPSQQHSRKKYLVGTCAFNEGDKIRRVVEKCNDYASYDVLIIDDGSNDGSIEILSHNELITIIRNENTSGAGHGVRQIIDYADLYGYQVVIFISGNDKDDARDISQLIKAIEDGADFVQGSRYLAGGGYGNMPLYRRLATQFIHPWLFSIISGQHITDSTNGFRAIRVSILRDPRLDLNQSWLDQYELEPYLFYKAIRLGFKVREVPVKKIYPPKKEGYTKMKPFSGWWSILRPLVLLGLRIKK